VKSGLVRTAQALQAETTTFGQTAINPLALASATNPLLHPNAGTLETWGANTAFVGRRPGSWNLHTVTRDQDIPVVIHTKLPGTALRQNQRTFDQIGLFTNSFFQELSLFYNRSSFQLIKAHIKRRLIGQRYRDRLLKYYPGW
jgi:hypothetical protein